MPSVDLAKFDAIRPFNDAEVPAAIARLLASKELIAIVIHTQFPNTPEYLLKPLGSFLHFRIARQLKDVTTVEQFQRIMTRFLEGTIQRTMTEFTWSGMEAVGDDRPYLFISNHRDITLDSALLNFALTHSGKETAEIAIGDNLLSSPLAADLLRLNKSFVVQRSVTGMKAKLKALTQLSEYIYESQSAGRNLWIAQREGRAKDGADRTDPAIIKMLNLWPKKQGWSYQDLVQRYNIVPVSISYEYDPCDALKASERMARLNANYVKSGSEDFRSIVTGLVMPKGRVHIEIGTPLSAELDSPQAIASAIDEQIIANYRLFPNSWLALQQLVEFGKFMSGKQDDARQKLQALMRQAKTALATVEPSELATKGREFSTRVARYPEQIQQYILEMYANPLLSKYQLSL